MPDPEDRVEKMINDAKEQGIDILGDTGWTMEDVKKAVRKNLRETPATVTDISEYRKKHGR